MAFDHQSRTGINGQKRLGCSKGNRKSLRRTQLRLSNPRLVLNIDIKYTLIYGLRGWTTSLEHRHMTYSTHWVSVKQSFKLFGHAGESLQNEATCARHNSRISTELSKSAHPALIGHRRAPAQD
ncbi:unnamed protein product [Leptosia nina]|uniref:Uncharacterized protein n=1 Tax=Leptosia nina TaxID=320188 RepID=A0AAV1K5F1_9NEOP